MGLIANGREAVVATAFLLYALIIWLVALIVDVEPLVTDTVAHLAAAFLVALALATHWSVILIIASARQQKGEDIAVQMALAYAFASLTFAVVADLAGSVTWALVLLTIIGALGSAGPLSILRMSEE